MLEVAFSPVLKVASAYASVANALNVGTLKKLGLIKEGTFQFQETLGSAEKFNRRLDAGTNVPFLFHVFASANLTGFLDPTNEEYFLSWKIDKGSYVTLPGLAENEPITRGTIKLTPLKYVEYFFEFIAHDGKKYYYRGIKNLRSVHAVKAWATLTGSLHNHETEVKILESQVFSNQDPSISGLIPFLRSLRIW